MTAPEDLSTRAARILGTDHPDAGSLAGDLSAALSEVERLRAIVIEAEWSAGKSTDERVAGICMDVIRSPGRGWRVAVAAPGADEERLAKGAAHLLVAHMDIAKEQVIERLQRRVAELEANIQAAAPETPHDTRGVLAAAFEELGGSMDDFDPAAALGAVHGEAL